MVRFLKNLLAFTLLALGHYSLAQNQQLLKHFLTVENGLSHNEVTSIIQDKDGFIWIGTRGGLNRYDGYEFKVFNQVPGDTNSLVNPSIESLFVDSKGNIWIGTKSGGVSKYNPVTGIFKNIVSNYKKNSNLISGNRVLAFYEDRKGQIWMGTWENGLTVYNENTNQSQHYLGANQISTIIETSDGSIWLGGSNGVYAFSSENNTFKHFSVGNCNQLIYDNKRKVLWFTGGIQKGLRKLNIKNHQLTAYHIENSFKENQNLHHTYECFLIDKNNKFWIGTWGTGFYSFNPEQEKFERHLIYPDYRAELNKDYDTVIDIFQDKDNNMWIGTNGGGICVLSPKLAFKSVGYHPDPGKGLSNTRIMSVVDDKKGNLWLGTIGSGLFWSPDRNNFYAVPNNQFQDSRFFVIKYLYEDHSGKIWAGTNEGIYMIEFKNGKPRMINAEKQFDNNTFWNTYVSILDTENILWLGGLDAGLYLLDKENNFKTIKRLTKNDPDSGDLNSNRISCMLQDSKQRIWIGTYNGLHFYNSKDTTVQIVENHFSISGEFTGNIITCLNEDLHGNIWIGTPNGLNKLSEKGIKELTVEYYSERDGLASNFVKGISHDAKGNIWLSTNIGISKFEFRTGRFINFDETDGVLGKYFTEASVFRNSNGEIFFGGTQGLTFFNPNKIVTNSVAFKPVFTSLKVLGKIIEAREKLDSKEIISKSVSHTNFAEFSYRQNNFEIEFSALDYKAMGRNQYMYKLENHDKDWHKIGTRRFVNFNNLKPGNYKLLVKSSNSHNVWNQEPAILRIRIQPPFWQSWYALLFYILVVVFIVSVIRWNAVKQVRLANSLEMEKMQHDQDLKLNEMKLRFFTNISHEFRTPLTLILAPLKELLGKKEQYELSNEAQNKIGIIKNNTVRLMKLVNQLLDFRKVESGSLKLAASNTNFEEFVAEVCHPFFELAHINKIHFKLNSSLKKQSVWLDRDKFEIIINNLVSNTFKNVHENGEIEISLCEDEDVVSFSVSDNGSGIPSDKIKHIFDRYYSVGKNENQGSSGIGLALVKRYIELHHGSISVVSEPTVHTEFIVSLPKGKKHLKLEEMVSVEKQGHRLSKEEQSLRKALPVKTKSLVKSQECILIVEDNPEINEYITGLLEPLYCVKSAFNGLEGYDIAIEKIPSLIISDIMMPKIDGFEFCQKIRANEMTVTIPFIFLTAKSDEQFKLLGTQIGADDFISKPFDPNLLLEKVKNILESRKKLQKQYSKSIRLEPSDIEITSSEEIFVGKIISFIEENLQNHKFTSDVLASEMNMSNSSLYRKLKALTGSSTAEFVRSIRIKRAAQLLADKDRTITEIAYEVGFNDVKHFRSVFQKQFSCSPSGYREKLL
jgi:signal transduction histidine kinase/DNA-binding response OmpR family regulator/streptogramin lyase